MANDSEQALAVISAGLSILRTDIRTAEDALLDRSYNDALAAIGNIKKLAQVFEEAANPELITPEPSALPVNQGPPEPAVAVIPPPPEPVEK